LISHSGALLRPLQEPLVSQVPPPVSLCSLDQTSADVPIPFHKFLLVTINFSPKGYLIRANFSTARVARAANSVAVQQFGSGKICHL
jgi:hypothetical protein